MSPQQSVGLRSPLWLWCPGGLNKSSSPLDIGSAGNGDSLQKLGCTPDGAISKRDGSAGIKENKLILKLMDNLQHNLS